MFSLQLKYTGFPPEKRKYNNAVKAVLAQTARNWHQEYYEHHFTHAGASDYGYFKRKGDGMGHGAKGYRRTYTARKERRFGHKLPLRHTSTGYRLGKVAQIRSTHQMGRVVLPTVFNFRHSKSRIMMREELTKVLPRELDHLRQLADTEMGRQIHSTST